MTDFASVPPVRKAMVQRLTARLGDVLAEEPATLETRLSHLDAWTLAALLRVTPVRDGGGPPWRRRRHLGVVGVDHSLNQLVVGDAPSRISASRSLEAVDLDQLDDEDLIAASRYVPETLPGYLLG